MEILLASTAPNVVYLTHGLQDHPRTASRLTCSSQEPVPVQDDSGNVVCYMIEAHVFDDENSAYNLRLQALLKEADDSPEIPAEESHKRIRQHTKELIEKYG